MQSFLRPNQETHLYIVKKISNHILFALKDASEISVEGSN